MKKYLHLLLQPLTLRVNFRDMIWDANPQVIMFALLAAVGTDLLANYVLGMLSLWKIVFSLATLLYYSLPRRLAYAIACLYISQAVISFVVVVCLASLHLTLVATILSYGFSVWCTFALVKLVLLYIRTPKVH